MKPKTILLVEDNPDDVKLTLHAFKKCGVANNVAVAANGADALDYLFATGSYAGRNPDDSPAIVLLDLKLPKIDGFEVLHRIRANPRTAHQPVIILTSSKEEQDIIASYNLGANSYVRKPVDFDKFTEAAHNLGLYWLLLNEPLPSGKALS